MSNSKKTKSGSTSGTPPASPKPEAFERHLTKLTETNRQLKRKIFDLYTIFEISRNFNSVLDYQTLLDSFVLTCLAQVGAAKGAVFLKEDGQSDSFVMARGKGSGAMPGPALQFKTGSRLLDYLTRLNRPVTTEELAGDLAAGNEQKILKIFQPGLVVPLIYQTRLSGLLLVSDKISGRPFHVDDVEFLSILGNQIAVAIENARLYDAEKAASTQLRAAQQQLLDSERLAALGEMSAKVAHEINNPLGIIKNYLLLIRRSLRENVEARNYTDVVSQEISRIARIVKELMQFHRPDGLPLEPTDMATVVEEVLALMSQKLEKNGITVVRQINNDLPPVPASAEHLKQVVLNLVINAADAMPDGGTLEVGLKTAGEQLSVRFADTGPGIPVELIPHIFEPFFTTKKFSEGTGLGLSVCYGIIRRHKGSILFHNTDRGGCFEILLPIHSQKQSHG